LQTRARGPVLISQCQGHDEVDRVHAIEKLVYCGQTRRNSTCAWQQMTAACNLQHSPPARPSGALLLCIAYHFTYSYAILASHNKPMQVLSSIQHLRDVPHQLQEVRSNNQGLNATWHSHHCPRTPVRTHVNMNTHMLRRENLRCVHKPCNLDPCNACQSASRTLGGSLMVTNTRPHLQRSCNVLADDSTLELSTLCPASCAMAYVPPLQASTCAKHPTCTMA
jgi:hypothetical protein